MPIVDFKSSLMLSDVIATELSELPIVWEMWNYNNKFKGIEYIKWKTRLILMLKTII